jgi:hypothetical protein
VGGNREAHEAENNALARIPSLCVRDQDDAFNCTYAHLTFNVSEPWREPMLNLIAALEKMPLGAILRGKLKSILDSLHDKDSTPADSSSNEKTKNLIRLFNEVVSELNLIQNEL